MVGPFARLVLVARTVASIDSTAQPLAAAFRPQAERSLKGDHHSYARPGNTRYRAENIARCRGDFAPEIYRLVRPRAAPT